MSGRSGFRDRTEAGVALARALVPVIGTRSCVVLAIPRGGVVVAMPVARALAAPLDVVVPRKVGAPHNPELGIGAVAQGVRILDRGTIAGLGLDERAVGRAVALAEEEMRRRTLAYRGDRPAPAVLGRVAVLVDDGIATGGTALAAIAWARDAGAERVVLAAPVAPREVLARLRRAADDVVILATPAPFLAVGRWYERFDQVDDEEVRAALAAT